MKAVKRLIAITGFCATTLLGADLNFYYTLEAPPALLPGVLSGSDGILVLARGAAADITVCVQYTTKHDSALRSACVSAKREDNWSPYQPIRLNLGASADDFRINELSVTSGDTTKSIVDPKAAVEY